MNDQLIKKLQKNISETEINQELPAGSTGRRYDPSLGTKKHNERIHRESKYTDDYKNLQFTFRKPSKSKGMSTYVRCDNCGNITSATSITVGIICKKCKKFSSVTEVKCDW
ncbi:hypothetical protein KAW18_03600 [candidate division WOR-3 bacterium]|nr:hypothetical protein [candidate division WOR-3 bacterium]